MEYQLYVEQVQNERKSITQLFQTFSNFHHFSPFQLTTALYINLQIASYHKTYFGNPNQHQFAMLKVNSLLSDEDYLSKRTKNTVEIRKGNREDIFMRRRLIHSGRDTQLDENGHAITNTVVIDERLRNETLNYASMDFGPDDLDRLLKDIATDDLMMKLHGAIGLKKILACEGEMPIVRMQAPQLVRKLLLLANDQQWPQIQYQGLCSLVNFTSFKTGDSFHIIDQEGLTVIIDALSSCYPQIVEQAIWTLENICIDHYMYRDRILKTDAVDKVIQLAVEYSGRKLLDECCSLLSSLCRGKPLPSFKAIQKILNTLCYALSEGLIQAPIIVSECLWAISYHCEGMKDQHECVVESKLLFQIIKIIQQTSEPQFLVPCARIIGNISSGDKKCTQLMFSSGIIDTIFTFLKSERKILRRQACWTLSNLAATDAKQIANIHENAELMTMLSDLFKKQSVDIRKEICLILENMVCTDTKEPLEELYVQMGFMNTYADILSNQKECLSLLKVALESLIQILRFSLDRKKQKGRNNMLINFLQEEQFVKILENLQTVDNSEIYNLTYTIMCCCFEVTELYEFSKTQSKRPELKID